MQNFTQLSLMVLHKMVNLHSTNSCWVYARIHYNFIVNIKSYNILLHDIVSTIANCYNFGSVCLNVHLYTRDDVSFPFVLPPIIIISPLLRVSTPALHTAIGRSAIWSQGFDAMCGTYI